MISKLPSSVPALEMSRRLREVFTWLFAPDKVLMARCGPINDGLYKRALNIRKKKRKYRFSKFRNEQLAK
jgi:hypothetical protein